MASVERGPAKVLPLLKDVAATKREALFIQKLEICSTVYRFDTDSDRGVGVGGFVAGNVNASVDVRGKEVKRETLMELLDFINAPVRMSSKMFCLVF